MNSKLKTVVVICLMILTSLTGACRKEQPSGTTTAAPAARELVVCSYGGAYQEAQRKAFFEPFERETGIKIREAQWSGEYAKLKAMVEAGQPTWDLVTVAEGSTIVRVGSAIFGSRPA